MATTATKTAGQICTRAMRYIGVAAIDEPVSAEHMATALEVLDAMLKSWQLRGVRRYSRATQSVAVTDATASYALSPRLHALETVLWKTGGIETPMIRMNASEYYELPDKTSAGRPTQFYYDRQAEVGTLYVWPVLATAAGETIEIVGTREVEDIASKDDVLDLPAEGYRAVAYCLADDLLDEFGVRDPITVQSIKSKAFSAKIEFEAWGREDSVFFMPEEFYG